MRTLIRGPMGFLLALVLMCAVGTISTRFFAGDGVAPTPAVQAQDISVAASGLGDVATQPTITSFWISSIPAPTFVATYSGTYALDQIRGPDVSDVGMWLFATVVIVATVLFSGFVPGYDPFSHLRRTGNRAVRRLVAPMQALRRSGMISLGRIALNSRTTAIVSVITAAATLFAVLAFGLSLVVLGGISLALATIGTLTYERRHLSQRDRVGASARGGSTLFSDRQYYDPGSLSGVRPETVQSTTTTRGSPGVAEKTCGTQMTLGLVGST